MNKKHYIKSVCWGFVVWVAMHNRNLQSEHSAYQVRCWNCGLVALDDRQWLHRRWFPQKYAYEVSCPECGGTTTSFGLCMECGQRWDVTRTFGRPM